MRAILTGLLSAALVLGIAGAADAKSQKTVTYYYYTYETQPTLAERQSRASTFDQTKYYERDSRKIPFGTAEWWRQMEREGGRKR